MYKLEKQTYGIKLSLFGDLSDEEIYRIADEVSSIAGEIKKSFSVFVDARDMMVLEQSNFAALVKCQRAAKRAGIERSVVVLNSPVLRNQVVRAAVESGISDRERYICAVRNKNWEKDGLEWLLHGKDPDPKLARYK